MIIGVSPTRPKDLGKTLRLGSASTYSTTFLEEDDESEHDFNEKYNTSNNNNNNTSNNNNNNCVVVEAEYPDNSTDLRSSQPTTSKTPRPRTKGKPLKDNNNKLLAAAANKTLSPRPNKSPRSGSKSPRSSCKSPRGGCKSPRPSKASTTTPKKKKKTAAQLPPLDPSSSNQSIQVLVCTANLGNAPPDANSWNAWIPKNGKLIRKTRFPVRFAPPPLPETTTTTTTTTTESKQPAGNPLSSSRRTPSRQSSKLKHQASDSKRQPPQRQASDSKKPPQRQASDSKKPPQRQASDLKKPPQRQASDSKKPPQRQASDLRRQPPQRQASDYSKTRGPPRRSSSENSKAGIPPRRSPSESSTKTAASVSSNRDKATEAAYDTWIVAQQKKQQQQQMMIAAKKPSPVANKTKSTNNYNIDDEYENFLKYLKEYSERDDSENSDQAIDKDSIKGSTYEEYLKSLEQPANQSNNNNNNKGKRNLMDEGEKYQKVRKKSPGEPATPVRPRRRSSMDHAVAKESPPGEPATPVRPRRRSSIDHAVAKESPPGEPATPVRPRRRSSMDHAVAKESPVQKQPRRERRRSMSMGNDELKELAERGEPRRRSSTGQDEKDEKPRRRSSMGGQDEKGETAEKTPVAARQRRHSIGMGSSTGDTPQKPRERSSAGQKQLSPMGPPMVPTLTEGRNGISPPNIPATEQAGVVPAEVFNTQLKEVDIQYSGRSSTGIESPCYDIIVIGMQEATFSTSLSEEEKKKQKEEEKKSKMKRDSKTKTNPSDGNDSDDSDDASIDSIESNDDNEDENANAAGDGSMSSMSDNDEDLNASAEEVDQKTGEKKKKKKGIMHATKQAGRKGLKIAKRISKVTSKTAKTVNTFAGAGKDHTFRRIPTTPFSMIDELNNASIEGEASVPTTPKSLPDLPLFSTEDDGKVDLDGTSRSETNTSNKKWTDTDVLHHGLETNQLVGYTRALSYQMRLLVYYKSGSTSKDSITSFEILSVKYQATGKVGLANKGGIVAEVAINKTTRLSFLTAHLEAHEGEKHYNARNDSFKDILMETGSKHFDASQVSHFTFAMGDLNYRTRLADVQIGSERHIRLCHAMAQKHAWRTLNKYDELQLSLDNQTCLVGFKTPYCNFPPTFKVARKDGCCYNVKRSPSYTDRILFKNADRLDSAMQLLLYEPVEDFVSSDHKPIRSGFSIRLNRDVKWKSTAQLLLEAGESSDSGSGDMSTDDGTFQGIPKTTTGNIDADRESMHFFVTNIQCAIIPHKYDYIRKQEKAELPSPKLLFIPNPLDAVMPMDDASKKKLFGFNLRKKKETNAVGSNENISETTDHSKSSKKSKFPSTPIAKETMRPIWKEGHVYFALQTHTEHGRPIDFSGGQLHISLIDAKTGVVIGSHCLNLSHLIIVSRERANSAKTRKSKSRPGKERGAKPNSKTKSQALSESSGQSKSGPVRGYQIVPHPSPALRAAARTSVSTFGTVPGGKESHLPAAVQKAADSLIGAGTSANLFDAISNELGGKRSNGQKDRKLCPLEEFGVKSFRLNETLIEGGLVVGHIKCDIDVWWN